jgi:hypothetical protein
MENWKSKNMYRKLSSHDFAKYIFCVKKRENKILILFITSFAQVYSYLRAAYNTRPQSVTRRGICAAMRDYTFGDDRFNS